MVKYDVIVVGGGIAGSRAAKMAADCGLSTLLLEKCKTPRNKPCSGIQFAYFERLLGSKIPPEKLCHNELKRIEMVLPNGKVVRGKMRMLNFMREPFDDWLNSEAMKAGAEFQDETVLLDFQEDQDVAVRLRRNATQEEVEVHARYLIDAEGTMSKVRMKLRPEDYETKRSAGATINYYLEGEGDLDENTLYMFYRREFCPMMFAWVYKKNDLWVVGTGADDNPLPYARRFLDYIRQTYKLNGQIVRTEGYSSTFNGGIFLGQGNELLVGDAAGLIDEYRGMGMDAAALSAIYAVEAIMESQKDGRPAITAYSKHMEKIIRQIERDKRLQSSRFGSDAALEKSMTGRMMLLSGLRLLLGSQLNKILPPDRIWLLP
ncbi:MAG: NAD(P)/FAD-dependent oxidoreductase [Candidatus Methanomethylicus sp.]|nr:NAD(P)/FAD-dependent oxidoreductase [Candidatus Methanomethylicus sp.]